MDSKKATFNLDAHLHQQLKVAAAVQRREMVDLVRDALTAYLGWNRMTDTEQSELKLYELTEAQGKGRRAHFNFTHLSTQLGTEWAIVAQMLEFLEAQRRLTVEVWDGAMYRPLHSFGNTDCLYVNGGELHVQLTIPGRMRYELLQQQRAWEATQTA
jgi:hypothetical protein